MSRVSRGRKFAGLTVALVTPFRDGEVDYEELGRSIDWQIAKGTPTISPVGTTGESPTLTHDEHERIIASSSSALRAGRGSWPAPGRTPRPRRSA